MNDGGRGSDGGNAGAAEPSWQSVLQSGSGAGADERWKARQQERRDNSTDWSHDYFQEVLPSPILPSEEPSRVVSCRGPRQTCDPRGLLNPRSTPGRLPLPVLRTAAFEALAKRVNGAACFAQRHAAAVRS